MFISSLAIGNFRNLTRIGLEPHPHFNVLAGDNGAGKSSVLESIFMLANVRSFRPGNNRDLIQLEQDRATVVAEVESSLTKNQVRLEIEGRRKRYSVNDKAFSSFARYLGTVVAVLFAPSDLQLLRGSGTDRRRWLDRVVIGARPAHLADLTDYEAALKARNQILKSPRVDELLLAAYTEQLIPLGARIAARRARVLAQLEPRLRDIFSALFSPDLSISIGYSCTWMPQDTDLTEEVERLEAGFTEALLQRRGQELRAGHTLTGPHRDDLRVTLGGLPVREYASQGQMRASVLALKMAEVRFLEEASGERPILLLDDVSSELDAKRNAQLFEFVRDIQSQTFITTTDRQYIQIQDQLRIFRVEAGDVVAA